MQRKAVVLRNNIGREHDLAVSTDALELTSPFASSSNLQRDILPLVLDQKIRSLLPPCAFEVTNGNSSLPYR